MADKTEQEAFKRIWSELTAEKLLHPSSSPQGFVLGGQPGAGKSRLVVRLRNEMGKNLLVINGDEFRRYHPKFDEIQERYGKHAPKHTAEFSAKMTGMVIEKALAEGYNISVEGTFRTAETPLKTLDDMRRHGYGTTVCIQTAPAEVSWQSTLERYDAMLSVNEAPRYTDKAHHDLVTDILPENADRVYQSGKADRFLVYSRENLLFDSRIHQGVMPGQAIDGELHRNSRELERLEAAFGSNAHLLSDKQKLVIQEAEKIIGSLKPADAVTAKINLYSSQLKQLRQNPSPDKNETDIEIDR